MSLDERNDKLRVLVVDDVPEHRRRIVEMLLSHPRLHVVGVADNGATALKLVPALRPDVATVDLAMPRMDGFTFLRLVMAYTPLPVVLVTAQQQQSQMLAALDAGALDFVIKPALFGTANLSAMRDELIKKVLTATAAQALPLRKPSRVSPLLGAPAESLAKETPAHRVICIGASTGGPRLLHILAKSVAPMGHTALCIAQHMPENFTTSFAQRLDRLSQWHVQEAVHGMPVVSHGCYVAPGGSHLALVKVGATVRCEVTKSPGTDEYVPSVDHLFRSAAALFKHEAMAVVLTGMGNDGSIGVRHIHGQGGRVLAEQPEQAVVDRMPIEAIRTGCVDATLSLDALIAYMQAFCQFGAAGLVNLSP